MKIYIKTSVDLNIDSIEKYNFQTKRKRMANILAKITAARAHWLKLNYIS